MGQIWMEITRAGGSVLGGNQQAQRVDAGVHAQVVVQVRHVQRRQQLAHRQVADAAEDD